MKTLLAHSEPSSASAIHEEPYELVNLAAIIRQCRLQICEAYYRGGHEAALAALAAASIRLYRYVDNGSLIGKYPYEALCEVAAHLTLNRVLGDEAVAAAIDTGPQFYNSLAGEA